MPKNKRADRALVGVVGGSTSDFPILEKAVALLNELGIPNELLVVSAHLDTVFPAETDVTVKRVGSRLCAPGIADDCAGLAALLALIETLDMGAPISRTGPAAILVPMARPVASTSPVPWRSNSWVTPARACEATVSGRAWTT